MTHSRRNFLKSTTLGVASLGLAPLQDVANTLDAGKAGKRIKKIPTVAGFVDSNKLGKTLMHEHVIRNIAEKDREKSVEVAVKFVKEAARVGIDTLVDLTPLRDITLFKQVAKEVPVNIIVSTGAYRQSTMPAWLTEMSSGQFKDRMRKEISEGIDGSGIKAGIIKVAAANAKLTDWEKMIFSMAGQVQKELKLPVATHATHEPRQQFDLLVRNGATPDRLYFCHIEAGFGRGGRNREQMGTYLVDIAKEGGNLLFNNFGYDFDTPWPDLVYYIRHLCDKGFAHKVLISIDSSWYWKNDQLFMAAEENHPAAKIRTFSFMITDAVPALLKAGFSADEIKIFLINNPERIFQG